MLVVTQDGLHTLREDEIESFSGVALTLKVCTFDGDLLTVGEYESRNELLQAYDDYLKSFNADVDKFVFPERGFQRKSYKEDSDD